VAASGCDADDRMRRGSCRCLDRLRSKTVSDWVVVGVAWLGSGGGGWRGGGGGGWLGGGTVI